MAAERTSAKITTGMGAALELLGIPGTPGLYVPTSVVKGLDPDGNPRDVEIAWDGSLKTTDEGAVPPRALQYARDSFDRMRVVVDASIGFSSLLWGNQNSTPTWYGAGAPGAMDSREQQRELALQSFRGQRKGWAFT